MLVSIAAQCGAVETERDFRHAVRSITVDADSPQRALLSRRWRPEASR